jgi:anti-sigma regulatory factor (Ser/Thr protein kinase)
MKLFYSGVGLSTSAPLVGDSTLAVAPAPHTTVSCTARIAVYEAPGAAPRVEEVAPAPIGEFIDAIASRVHRLTGEAGGDLPYTVVREVAENLVHAGFAEPVISILDSGATVRFADQGPGIPEKDRAVLPGYTTASGSMKEFIRGVGSGFPIVRDFLTFTGGTLVIEDNLGHGSVVTIRSKQTQRASRVVDSHSSAERLSSLGPDERLALVETVLVSQPRLTNRQTQVLALVLESGSAGPSLVAKELAVGLSTAYRDLALLEERGLIVADGGKRTVTEHGLLFLDQLAAR